MGSYTVEQVEFLRQRADITYEQALEVLELCNGDLTRCLVELERRGLIRKSQRKSSSSTQNRSTPYYDKGRVSSGSSLNEFIKKILYSRLFVTQKKRTVADLPIPYVIFAAIAAPHLMVISVVLMFVFGHRIRFEWGKINERPVEDDLFDIVDKAADSIKETVSSFKRAAKSSDAPYAQTEPKQEPKASAAPEYTAQSAPAQEAPKAPQEPVKEAPINVDIPDVPSYEEFTQQDTAPQSTPLDVEPQADDESEITIG